MHLYYICAIPKARPQTGYTDYRTVNNTDHHTVIT